MSNNPKKATHEQLLAGDVYTTCILNEPIVDFVVNFEVKAESATARALQRWFESREDYERRGI